MDNIVKGKEGEFRIDKVTFYKVIKKFSKSGKRNYDFLVKAGDNFKEAIYKMCERMFEEETFPKEF